MVLRVALVGVGYWGKNYVRVLSELSDKVSLVGLVDSRGHEYLTKWKRDGLKLVDDLDKIIDELDCVIIATPARTHYNLVKKCIQAGKHVLVEKPLTLSTYESSELVELADKMKIILMVGFTVLFIQGFKFLQNYVHDKGGIYYVYAKRTNLGIVRTDCDVVHDLTSHDIATVISLMKGVEPTEVCAMGGSYVNSAINDVSFITLKYPNNVVINLHTSWIDSKKCRELVVVSKDYRIEFDDTNIHEPIRICYKSINNMEGVNIDKDIHIPQVEWKEPLKSEVLHFYDLVNGLVAKDNAVSTGKLGLKVNRVMDAIEKSFAIGGGCVAVS
jgi:predicted dehydrogenase